jgi:hypothetical protein
MPCIYYYYYYYYYYRLVATNKKQNNTTVFGGKKIPEELPVSEIRRIRLHHQSERSEPVRIHRKLTPPEKHCKEIIERLNVKSQK